MPEKVLDYKLTEAKAEIVDGERSQEAVVVQEPKENVVNTISVNEVDDKIKKVKQCDCEPNPDVSNCSRIYSFEEATVLTDAILEQVKSGDIVKVANMEFVVNNKVNQSPRSITGKILGAVTSSSITVISLDWVKGQELEPEMITLTIASE